MRLVSSTWETQRPTLRPSLRGSEVLGNFRRKRTVERRRTRGGTGIRSQMLGVIGDEPYKLQYIVIYNHNTQNTTKVYIYCAQSD